MTRWSEANATWLGTLACAGIVMANAVAPASAQRQATEQHAYQCMNVNNAYSPDQRIEGCTIMIASGVGTAEATAQFFHMRGIAYREKRDLEHAIADYSEAIRLNPKRAEAYHDRGMAYAAKDKFDDAVADMTEAILLDRKYTAAFIDRGRVYTVAQKYDEAIADFSAALRIDPVSATAFLNRGVAQLLRGNTAGGDADIVRALELDPNPRISGGATWKTFDLGIPADVATWPVTVTVEAAGASVLFFTPGRAQPVRFATGESTKDVPLNGPTLFVFVPLRTKWNIKVILP
jgi:tetratricopeptide (TPR) repeat protein